MGDEQPSLHIDSDWKKQAQEEKRKLAEQAAKAKTAAPPTTPTLATAPGSSPSQPVAPARKPGRALPQPGFGSLVQSVMTQILYYLGELASSTGQGSIDLDLARHHLDTLGMLEEKTKNNLTSEEQGILDAALYETRTRFVSIATQFLGP